MSKRTSWNAIDCPEGMGWCSNGHFAPVNDFHKNKRTRSGLAGRCKPHANAAAVEWGRQNRERKQQSNERYHKRNPELRAAIKHRRRGRIESTDDGTATPEFFAALYTSPCVVCGSTKDIQADHIVPVFRGGANSASNLQPLCAFHNQSKGTRTMEEWLDAGLAS